MILSSKLVFTGFDVPHFKIREILTQAITAENVNYNDQNVEVERPAKLSSHHKRLLLKGRSSY